MPIGPENANVVGKKVCVSTRKLGTKNKQHFKTMTVMLGRILFGQPLRLKIVIQVCTSREKRFHWFFLHPSYHGSSRLSEDGRQADD